MDIARDLRFYGPSRDKPTGFVAAYGSSLNS
jgi:hypothetical protein